MRYYEFIFEGYIEAQTEFTQVASPDEVMTTINAFKALVNKNQVQGNERNIDWWRKQGWDQFNKFVTSKQETPTKTQIKRSKIVGNSITLREDAEWLIVIPLDKDASCFHGKGSDWCTTKHFQSYFEDYFYDKKVVLIYCLQKNTGNMWAIAGHKQLDKLEIFDKKDTSINEQTFTKQTGLNASELVNAALESHGSSLDTSRTEYERAIEKINAMFHSTNMTDRDPALEKLLLFTKSAYYINRYVKKLANIHRLIDIPKELRIPLLHEFPESVTYLKFTTEYEQYIVVKRGPRNFKYINNPTERICEYVVSHNALQIQFVPKNLPNYKQLCEIAVTNTGEALMHIPTNLIDYELCELAVEQFGRSLEFVPDKFKDYQLCKTAVESTVHSLLYVNPKKLTPDEYNDLCELVVTRSGKALYCIPQQLRTYELCKMAIKEDPTSFMYVPDDLPEYAELENYANQLLGY